MRKIIGAAFVSLDGVMQGPGGPTEDPTGGFAFSGWLPPVGDDSIEAKIGELFGRPFDLLLGRRTYDIFAAYWPYAPDEMADIRDPFNSCTKYVVTHGDEPLDGTTAAAPRSTTSPPSSNPTAPTSSSRAAARSTLYCSRPACSTN